MAVFLAIQNFYIPLFYNNKNYFYLRNISNISLIKQKINPIIKSGSLILKEKKTTKREYKFNLIINLI